MGKKEEGRSDSMLDYIIKGDLTACVLTRLTAYRLDDDDDAQLTARRPMSQRNTMNGIERASEIPMNRLGTGMEVDCMH